MPAPGVAAARAAFDLGPPSEHCYINAAGRSPLLKASHAAATAAVGMKLRPWEFGDADAPRAKELFASHLGAPATAADVAVCPSAAYAISTVAANIQLAAGDEVVLLEEHYASVLPWQHAAELAGAAVVAVPRALGPQAAGTPSITDALLRAITPRTAVVTAAPCGWTDGAVVDLVAVSAACRAVGAALILDATQWVGAMPLDLTAIQPDAVVVSVHKWFLGLYSFAFLYLAPEGAVGRTMGSVWAKSGVPIEHHDRNRVGSDDWDNGRFFTAGGDDADSNIERGEGELGFPRTFVEGAARYDMGGRPNVVLYPPLILSMEWLHTAGGAAAIGPALRPMTQYVAREAARLGFTVPEHHSDHIVGIYPDPARGMPGADWLVARLSVFSVYIKILQ